MNIILWMFLMVPTQKCLDSYDAARREPENALTFDTRPRTYATMALEREGKRPDISIEIPRGEEPDCYEVFESSAPFQAHPFPAALRSGTKEDGR